MISEITVGTFERWLNELAPAELAASWDNVGLQVGSPNSKVRKVIVSLDPSIHVFHEAIENNCDLIVCHHPLLFNPLKKINIDESPGNCVRLAIINNISVLAAHTNLDATRGGVNDTLASSLGLLDVESVRESSDGSGDGLLEAIARVGYFKQALSVDEVCEILKEKLSVETVSVVSPETSSPVKKVMLCGGSGGSVIKLAIKSGCDALISGDIKYHDAMCAYENGIIIFDVGHFASERVIVSALADFFRLKVEECGQNIDVIEAESEKDPFTVV